MSYISQFNSKVNDHETTTKLINGSKGHNLIMMKHKGINVPSGIVISTQACTDYLELDKSGKKKFLDVLMSDIKPLVKNIWKDASTHLVSVRSGAPVSMPGMMDTILNVGIGYPSSGLGAKQKDLALDCKTRFVEMFLCVVHGLDHADFKWTLSHADHVEDLFNVIKNEYTTYQLVLRESIKAVFESWNTPRAIHYRKMNKIPNNLGTAVVIQAMVFGNYNDKSGAGVAFTRNPNNGRKTMYGNFLVNCQGEDVVNGEFNVPSLDELETWNPQIYKLLEAIGNTLEKDSKDMQEIEFTVENNILYILQTRDGQRSSEATVRIALDLKKEKVIKKLEGLIPAGAIGNLRVPTLPVDFKHSVFITGIASGGSIATGRVAKSVNAVLKSTEATVLVSKDTTPKDIKGMDKAVAIVTTTGGVTCHAAVVARGMNKACVVGCEELDLFSLSENDYMLVDGKTGNVYLSDKPFDVDTAPSLDCELVSELLELVDTAPYTVIVDSVYEARELEEHLFKIAIPVRNLDEGIISKDMKYLSDTFDAVILQNTVRVDSISEFLGEPIDPKSNILDIVELSITDTFDNILFDSAEFESDTLPVVPEFKNLADLMNPDFFGQVSKQFITDVIGGIDTYNTIREQLSLDRRVVIYMDLLDMIEFELGIG